MLDLPSLNSPVTELLGRELDEVAVIFERQLASELSAVNALCLHIEHYRGKMLRPALVLLSGLVTDGDPCDGRTLTDAHRVVAAVTEMIHMATLVHDDVLDEAEVRRRGDTVNHLWGNETAVMLGDYLISNAFHLCSTIGDPSINLELGEVTNTLCEGELSQLQHRGDHGLDEATYFEIINRKTASLIGACCRLGGRLAGADDAVCTALARAGRALGIAFQIQDDLLDLVGDTAVVGKTLGRDLEKGKMTLPIIRLLHGADPVERGRAIRLIEAADAAPLRAQLVETGAVDHARRTAEAFVRDAKRELETLPEGAARDVFLALAAAVVDRDY